MCCEDEMPSKAINTDRYPFSHESYYSNDDDKKLKRTGIETSQHCRVESPVRKTHNS